MLYTCFSIFIRFLKTKDILQSWNLISINSLMISCPISIKGNSQVGTPAYGATALLLPKLLLNHQCKSHGRKKKALVIIQKSYGLKTPLTGSEGYLLRSVNHKAKIPRLHPPFNMGWQFLCPCLLSKSILFYFGLIYSSI